MKLDRIANVSDARRLARRTLPAVIFDYIDGAADDEVTMRENERAFEDVVFRPRMACSVPSPDLSTTVLGTSVDLPVLLAPCGLVRAMHPDSAAGIARAAASRRTVSVLSTVAGAPVAAVAPEAPGRVWFQLYSAGGRPVSEQLCGAAAEAGVRVLVVTVDTPTLGNRERDVHHGVATPLRIDAHNALRIGPQVLSRPAWAYRMVRDGLRILGASRPSTAGVPRTTSGAVVSGLGKSPSDTAAERMLTMSASPFSWEDIAWLRSVWNGALVVKGLLSGDDAKKAVDCGAEAVVVSNHGGRQLDGAPATLQVLPEVVAAVGGAGSSTEVFLDGGVRRGSHVVKAVALGARAVLIGRPYLWGLAAGGQAGVERVLDLFYDEVQRTMVLLGCASVSDLAGEWLQPGEPPGA